MRRSTGAVLSMMLMLLQACAGASNTNSSSGPAPVITPVAKARIDSTLASFVSSGRVTGASALVWEKGREVYFGAYGLADREANRPMKRDAIGQIFSMTKPITGVALMQLYEQGRFQLDEPLAKYLPEYANAKVYAGDSSGTPRFVAPERAITIRDITRHTAGFAVSNNEPGIGALYRAADPSNRQNTIAEYSRRLASVPLSFQPGTKWSYGLSVDIQAALVEKLAGQSFGSYVRQHMLEPLSMHETRYFVPERDRDRFAALYGRNAQTNALTRVPDSTGKAFNTKIWPLEPGAFGLTSTVDDYMRFARMLLGGGQLEGVRILKPETVRLMATNHLPATVKDSSFLTGKGQVGFGIDFAVRVKPPQSAAENNGAVGEFFWDGAASTLFWVDPANQLTAVFFTQVVPFDGVLHKRLRDAIYGPIAASGMSMAPTTRP